MLDFEKETEVDRNHTNALIVLGVIWFVIVVVVIVTVLACECQ